MKRQLLQLAVVVVALATAACGKPGEASLKDSFAQQLGANKFVKAFEHRGDTLLFAGPGGETGEAKWRVRIDSAVVEPNNDPAKPYKGTVKSSWYVDERIVRPAGSDSKLPVELISNGLGQECWAFWDGSTKTWSWE